MKKKLWCSAHTPTSEQLAELGEVTLLSSVDPELQDQLNNTPSTLMELLPLANRLAEHNCHLVQPGGSPAFQFILGEILYKINKSNSILQYPDETSIRVYYAHSERVSSEEVQADGSVKKTSTFKHIKFITV